MSDLIESKAVQPTPQAADMRHALMSMPVAAQNLAMAEYSDRRRNFRDWVKSNMIEGIHFGFAPGCEPRSRKNSSTGELEYGVWNSKKNEMVYYPASQWSPKPSLYAAGADFLVDLLLLRSEFDADMDAHKQMGSKPDLFIFRCRLWSKNTGDLIGEGRGARKVGQKGGDENNAIKMAQKSALVAAVLNCYGLRDLFTQDAPPQPTRENPESDVTAPAATAREKRGEVSKEEVQHLCAEFLQKHGLEPTADSKRKFFEWAAETVGRKFPVKQLDQWTKADEQACAISLEVPTLSEMESLR